MQRLISAVNRWRRDYAPPSGRTGELFLSNLRQSQSRTDKLFYRLLLTVSCGGGGRFDMVAAGVVRLKEHDSLPPMVREFSEAC